MDSVNGGAGKLLQSVRDSSGEKSGDEDDRGEADGGPGSQRAQQKGTHRGEATLARSAARLRSKKLDQESSIEPLTSPASSPSPGLVTASLA